MNSWKNWISALVIVHVVTVEIVVVGALIGPSAIRHLSMIWIALAIPVVSFALAAQVTWMVGLLGRNRNDKQ